MGLPTLDTLSNEVSSPTHQFDETLEEIRAICRLHACPTGRWEDLVDLPLRISQDAGLRFDFIAIVHTLQRNRFNLPDVLDLLVLAIGGASAPRHSHKLGEQLNLLGGFLTGIGHWPSTDFEPILAPGEVPVDLAKFTRPQPPPTPSSLPQRSSAVEAPASLPSQIPSPRAKQSAAEEEPASPLPTPLSLQPEQSVAAAPASPLPATVSPQAERMEAEAPASPSLSTTPADISEIARALARLERGNLDLRAHLDSIDQRIGRMEPRLELTTPPSDLPPSDLPPAIDPFPPLLHRGTSGRDASQNSTHPIPVGSPSLGAQPSRAEAPQSTVTSPISVRDHQKLREARDVRELPRENGRHDSPRGDSRSNEPKRTIDVPAWAVTEELQKGAVPGRQRFSRFSLEPVPPGSVSPDPISPVSSPVSASQPIAPAAAAGLPFAPEEVVLKPSALPRGFFGTVPESDAETTATKIEPRSQRRHFGLLFTVFLFILLLGAAGMIYRRSIATEPDTAANSSDVTPVAAPRTSTAGAISSHGPLTATPTRPAATQQPDSSNTNKVLGARSAFRASQSTEEPHSGGFRPAGTFVPAAVMEGHLLSAPIPQQARTSSASSSSGLVVMEANISSTGQVEDLHILGGSSAHRIPAIEAVRNWRYRPYLLNGSPVEVRTIVRIDLNQHQAQPADRGAPFPP